MYELGAYGGCALHAPAGDVPLRVPMLRDTCVVTSETRVCGRFPRAPDGTGLPFL